MEFANMDDRTQELLAAELKAVQRFHAEHVKLLKAKKKALATIGHDSWKEAKTAVDKDKDTLKEQVTLSP